MLTPERKLHLAHTSTIPRIWEPYSHSIQQHPVLQPHLYSRQDEGM